MVDVIPEETVYEQELVIDSRHECKRYVPGVSPICAVFVHSDSSSRTQSEAVHLLVNS